MSISCFTTKTSNPQKNQVGYPEREREREGEEIRKIFLPQHYKDQHSQNGRTSIPCSLEITCSFFV